MAYSVAAIYSGIYAQMQTVKALLLLLICIGLLSACGLKGPLFLPVEGTDSTSGAGQQSSQAADEEKDKDESEKEKDRVPFSI